MSTEKTSHKNVKNLRQLVEFVEFVVTIYITEILYVKITPTLN